jgi:hypothetical protein
MVPTATAADVGSSLVRSKHARSGFPGCRTWQWSRHDGEAGDGVRGGFDGRARLQQWLAARQQDADDGETSGEQIEVAAAA